jgi:hypothetical protein
MPEHAAFEKNKGIAINTHGNKTSNKARRKVTMTKVAEPLGIRKLSRKIRRGSLRLNGDLTCF